MRRVGWVVGNALVTTVLSGNCLVALAADHSNLEEGLPLTLEDAYPTKANNLEVQSYLRYDRVRGEGGKRADRISLVPRFEAGIGLNTQLAIEAPYRLGNAPDSRQGDARANLLYNFNSESPVLPAFAVVGGVDQPFGSQRGGVESELGAIATKSLGSAGQSYVPRRLSASVLWFHNYDPLIYERSNRYRAGLVYAQAVSNDWVVLTDVYRETDRTRGSAQNVVEVGARYQLDPLTVVSAGLGAGIGPQSPKFRLMVGIQHSLTFPWSRP